MVRLDQADTDKPAFTRKAHECVLMLQRSAQCCVFTLQISAQRIVLDQAFSQVCEQLVFSSAFLTCRRSADSNIAGDTLRVTLSGYHWNALSWRTLFEPDPQI